MVVIKIKIFVIILVIFFTKNVFSSQIYDYQTEKFLEKIITEVLSVNNYKKNINFKIINDKFPNAFINQDSILHISSGLLIHSPDYVSLLAVIAHEIGHLENYHITKRKNEIKEIKNINSFGNIAAIAGSMIFQEPELINSIIVNQTALNNLYINFTQDQEREADIYSIKTLNKLKSVESQNVGWQQRIKEEQEAAAKLRIEKDNSGKAKNDKINQLTNRAQQLETQLKQLQPILTQTTNERETFKNNNLKLKQQIALLKGRVSVMESELKTKIA